MTYLNPVFHYGYDEFFKKCQETGVDGIIIPDCPYEESKEVSDICYKYDVDLISMIAPTSKERTLEIAAQAKGFIYLVSSMGVTGMRSNIVTDIEGIVESIKTVTDTPVAVGFGINSPAQVKHFGNIADGVIVGSAIVNLIKEHGDRAHQPLFNYIQTLIKEL
ncbi:tryptophan synthase alpha chain [Coprobacillus sp. CAG:183]|nr:tryptophan synthase alpha chain [Coprobacillus sp. CAG:183]